MTHHTTRTARPDPGSPLRRGLDRVRRAVTALPWSAQVAVLLASATALARSPGLVFNGMFDRDEAYLAVMGDVIRSGGSLYVDVVDRKPPLVPFAFALVRELSVDMRTVRFVAALAVLVNGLLVVVLVRRLTGDRRAAMAAGVLAVLGASWFLPADAQAANFELWALVPSTAGVLCAVEARGRSGRAWRWFVAAGALVALGAHAKQPFLAAGLPVAFEAVRVRANRGRNVVAGGLGAVLGTLPLFLLVDVGPMWRWAWADNGDYLDGGISAARAAGVGLGLTVVFLCFHLPLLYGVWAAISRRVRPDPAVVLWLVGAVVVLPLGLRFFGHYYQQLVPPLAVLTGVALATAPRWAWRAVGGAAATATLVLVGLAYVHRPDLTDFSSVAGYVQDTTEPGDRILVWGAIPDVYVASQRLPSGVFLHGGYLTGNWASRGEVLDASTVAAEPYRTRWLTFLDDLAEDPPEVIVDGSRPGTDWEPYSPSRYPIAPLLERCYRQVAVLDDLPVWVRDRAECPTP